MTQDDFTIPNSDDISPIDIHSGADLTGANLSDADLTDAFLGGADLRNANLSDATLFRGNLREAHLSEVDLSDISLHTVTLAGANLAGANLRYADLSKADFTNAILEEADLSGADLTNTTLPEDFETTENGANESRATSSDTNVSPDSEKSGDDNPDLTVVSASKETEAKSDSAGVSISEIAAVVNDPQIEGAIIITIREDGEITNFGVDHGSKKTVVQLAAAALREAATEAERGEEEFIKSVLNEYESQKRAENTF